MFLKLFILGVILAVTYGFSEDVEDSTEKYKNTKGCKIANCDVCNVNKKYCISCLVGWGRNNVGTCSACGANCNLCSSDVDVCTQCSTPTLYKLIDGQCKNIIATTINTNTQSATTLDLTSNGAITITTTKPSATSIYTNINSATTINTTTKVVTTVDTTTQTATTINTTTKGSTTIATTTIDPLTIYATSFLTTTQVLISKLDLTKSQAYQISNYFYYYASLAVDGNNSTDVSSCAYTDIDYPYVPNETPWWVVDLGNVTPVFKVAIYTNEQLDNIVVGVTNKFIPSEGVRLGEYPICNQNIGVFAAGSRNEVVCLPSTPPGQFLIIQQPANGPPYLTLCEVEVFVN